MSIKIKIKRIYDQAASEDGFRILVDRLWPRGITKSAAKIDEWAKDVAPSASLRKWFNHDPEKWEEFQKRYIKELNQNTAAVAHLLELAKKHPITLVYASKSPQNQATVLRDYLATHSSRSR